MYATTTEGDNVGAPTTSGETDTTWVDADYQVIPDGRVFNQPIDVEKNPLYKALKLGLTVIKDQKPPTMD